MDEFMLEFELLNQLEETREEKKALKAQAEEALKKEASPYQNKQQEMTGQLMSMFDDLDYLLQVLEEEEFAKEGDED